VNVGEMFAGIGGFRLGLEQANLCRKSGNSEKGNGESISPIKGTQATSESIRSSGDKSNFEQWGNSGSLQYNVVWANEWDKYACQIYRKNFGSKELVESDIHKISTDDIPELDLLCGGFPCQPHSLAGKRQGFKEVRGTVFHEIIRVARAKRPHLLLLENVKGLLSSEQGRAFGTVLEELGNIGYWCEWQTLNSKHFGVPQNRERVFIIGHLREGSTRQIFPIRESGSVYRKNDSEGQICSIITSRYYKRGHSDPYVLQQHSHSGPDGKGRGLRLFEGSCPTLTGQMGTGGGNVPMVAQALQTDGFLRSGSSFGTDKPQSSRNIRRLTPTECERLQGFPDGWTEGVSDTQRYKCLGNAVTVSVIEFLGRCLLACNKENTVSSASRGITV
jgi:DNA (cytosine-5)-methyltransferase 1